MDDAILIWCLSCGRKREKVRLVGWMDGHDSRRNKQNVADRKVLASPSDHLYPPKHVLAVLARRPRPVRIDERQVIPVRDAELLAPPDRPQRPVDDQLVREVPRPADVLAARRRMVEHGAQAEDDGLGLGGLAVRGAAMGPGVGVVIQRRLLDVRRVFGRVEDEDGAGVDDCSGGDVAACEDSSAWFSMLLSFYLLGTWALCYVQRRGFWLGNCTFGRIGD